MIYVGCFIDKPHKKTYLGSGTNIKLAIKSLGRQSFKREILHIYNNKIDMLAKEREIVNKEFVMRNDTYNIILGGGTFITDGCVVVKDINNNISLVRKTDSRYLSGELVGNTKGMKTPHSKPSKLKNTTRSQQIKDKIAISMTGKYVGDKHVRAKTLEITFPDGHKEIIKGLKKFCRDYNLGPKEMRKVARGEMFEHKKFKCVYKND